MPAVIHSRRSRGAKIKAASAPSPTSMIAAIGRPCQATKAATAIALPQADNIKRWCGPATSVVHSHNTAMAARPQNSANGQSPR